MKVDEFSLIVFVTLPTINLVASFCTSSRQFTTIFRYGLETILNDQPYDAYSQRTKTIRLSKIVLAESLKTSIWSFSPRLYAMWRAKNLPKRLHPGLGSIHLTIHFIPSMLPPPGSRPLTPGRVQWKLHLRDQSSVAPTPSSLYRPPALASSEKG